MIIGAALLLLGLALHFAPWLLQWFGRLPGDIRIERDGFTFYFPLASGLLVSAVISLILWILRR